MSLRGGLLSPEISFTFILPDADEMTKSKIYGIIDTANREEMGRQLANVLLFGRFEIPNQEKTSVANTGTNMGLYSLSELVSSQISKFVSGISDKLDFGFSYRPGEVTTENEYNFNFGGRFLNDRLTVRTNFGILEQQDVDAQNRFLGDVIAELALDSNGSFKAKAFNVTNPRDILSTYNSTYSQGVGFTYLKEFDTVKELFTRKNKNKKKTTEKQPITLPEEEE